MVLPNEIKAEQSGAMDTAFMLHEPAQPHCKRLGPLCTQLWKYFEQVTMLPENDTSVILLMRQFPRYQWAVPDSSISQAIKTKRQHFLLVWKGTTPKVEMAKTRLVFITPVPYQNKISHFTFLKTHSCYFYFPFLFETGSHYSPGTPRTHSVDHAALEFTEISLSLHP